MRVISVFDGFLRNIAYGKTGTSVSSFEEFAAVADVEAWDGKDGVLDVEQDVSQKKMIFEAEKADFCFLNSV